MEWLRTHPYTSALCAAGVFVLIGAFVVGRQAARPAGVPSSAWGGGATTLLNPTSYQPQNTAPDNRSIMQQVTDGPPYTYTPPAGITTAAPTSDGSYDFEAFIAMLTQGSAPKKQPDTSVDSSLLSAYAYIPRGLVSTTSSETTRTELQQSLYDYGNDIGSSIESYEQQHLNTVQILKGQVEDRTDPDKAAAVVNIGRALQDLGNNLAAVETVPAAMISAHEALAQSYVEIGKNLSLIPSATNDQDFIKAIQTYNASADIFTKNYIQMVSLFGAHGVAFSSIDAGSVFTFSSASGF